MGLEAPTNASGTITPDTLGYAGAARLIRAGSATRVSVTVIAALAGAATTALLVRALGASSYGRFAFVVTAASVIAALTQIGLDASTTQQLAALSSSSEGTKADIDQVIGSLLTLAMGGALIAATSTAWIVRFAPGSASGRASLAIGGGIMVAGAHLGWAGHVVAKGTSRLVIMEAPNLLQPALRFLIIAVLMAGGALTIGSAAAAFAVAGIIAGAAGIAIVLKVAPTSVWFTLNLAGARRLIRRSLPFALSGLAWILISRFDVLVLGLTRTSSEVGTYEPILRITEQAVLLFPAAVTVAFLPAASRLATEPDRTALANLYVNASRFTFVAVMPAIFLLAGFSESVLGALFGQDFPPGRGVQWILLSGFALHVILGLNGSTIAALHDRRRLTVVASTGLLTMVVSALVLIPAFGRTGAAAATTITYLTLNLAASWHLFKALGVHPFRRDHLATVLSAVGPIALVLVIGTSATPTLLQAIGLSVGIWVLWIAAISRIPIFRVAALVDMIRRPE